MLENGSVPCGDTNPLSTSKSEVYYLPNMEQAQFALNLQTATPPQNLVEAIGRGIGSVAAHEIGHQLRLSAMDDSSVGTYNGAGCDGGIDPATYTGKASDGTPIHWGDTSLQSLKAFFGQK